MAGELRSVTNPRTTSGTCYTFLWNAVGQIYRTDTKVFESYLTANIANYAITSTQQGSASGIYLATMPTSANGGVAGVYTYDLYKQAGGGPAETDTLLASGGQIEWTGSVISAGVAYLPQAAAGASGGLPTLNSSLNVSADLQTIKTQTVTCTAGVTVNVNVGTTQPVNFTGTGGSALVQCDTRDFLGQAVVLDANNLPKVDTEDWKGTAVNGTVAPDFLFVRSGTAQAGGASTITLDAGASATDNIYKNETVFISSGTGAGQSATIASYVGSTKVATINGTWATNPDATSVFTIVGLGGSSLTTAGIATAVWQDTTSGDFAVSGSIGKSLFTGGAAPGSNGGLPTVDANNNIHGLVPGTGTGQVNASGGKVPATLAATDVTGNVACDIQTIKTQTVTCAAGVTVGAFVGNATAALSVDASGRIDLGKWIGVAPLALSAQQVQAVIPSSTVVASVTGAVGSVTGNVGGNVIGSVGSVSSPVTVGTNNDKTGYSLTQAFPANFASMSISAGGVVSASISGGVTVSAYAAGQDPGTLIFDAASTVESYTFRQALRLFGAVLCGKSNSGPNNSVFVAMGGSATRVTSVDDNSGNRTSVTLTP